MGPGSCFPCSSKKAFSKGFWISNTACFIKGEKLILFQQATEWFCGETFLLRMPSVILYTELPRKQHRTEFCNSPAHASSSSFPWGRQLTPGQCPTTLTAMRCSPWAAAKELQTLTRSHQGGQEVQHPSEEVAASLCAFFWGHRDYYQQGWCWCWTVQDS